MTQFVAYYRVSTDKQGERGHGLDAQRRAVADYLRGDKPIAEFTEVESGKKHTNRPELAKAFALAKKHKATVIIANLSRLARNVAFIAGLIERKVPFLCCDMPNATPFMLQIYACVAEDARRTIVANTKAGLAAAKAKGVKLGNARQAAANREAAMARARAMSETLAGLADLSASAAAIALNAHDVPTPSGAPWSHKTVERARCRLASGPSQAIGRGPSPIAAQGGQL